MGRIVKLLKHYESIFAFEIRGKKSNNCYISYSLIRQQKRDAKIRSNYLRSNVIWQLLINSVTSFLKVTRLCSC
jgi:hypothetical protein